jgi:hypothetical protein
MGTSRAVFEQPEPSLECGITDVLVCSTAVMVSVAHYESAVAANSALLAQLEGRPVSCKDPCG